MGVTIIYLTEEADGRIVLSAESIGECDQADQLASQLMHGMLLLDNVSYSDHPRGIAAHPTSLEMQ